ncbi:hypothetical protein ACXR2W_10930 [Leucobacter sp. HY1908]
MGVRDICELAAKVDFRVDPSGKERKVSFNLNRVTERLLLDDEFKQLAPTLTHLSLLSRQAEKYVQKCLVRFALFGEFVTQDITTTWYHVRWTPVLGESDPRFASPEECMQILEYSAQLIVEFMALEGGRAVLEQLAKANRIQDGLPIDYRERFIPRLHAADNIVLLESKLGYDLVEQRSALLDRQTNPAHGTFEKAYAKLRVKTYKTDRVLTGSHKTNRELRWEVHPESVHFAFRGDCMRIERVLVAQLCHLSGLPTNLRDYLLETNLAQPDREPQRCPITLDHLKWTEFEAEMLDADHGRSSFQVGHMNPLKGSPDHNLGRGHTAQNVSWISQDGNRIQGHLSIDEVRSMLYRIAENYAVLT